MPKPAAGVLPDASRTAFKEWVDTNPLRVWRLSHDPKVSLLEAAQRLGVGMSMMQMYERGAHKPGRKVAGPIAELLGADWSEKWDAWYAQRPANR